MSRLFLLAVTLAALFSTSFAAISDDLITTLPGYGKTMSKQYSGFLAADDAQTVFLHYWFVESMGNPSTDPVLVWLNGGPGCSSLEGFLYEQGPLHFTGNRTGGVPTLMNNPYAWTNVASVIFLESPAGVGFSYAANGSTATTDEIVSQNNYGALKSFYKGFTEYAKNPLYITGESYAGIYVPTFAQRIYEGAQSGDNTFPLTGIAVGNACWGNSVGICALYNGQMTGVDIELEFLHNHAMISAPHWDALLAKCGNLSNPNPTDDCYNAINDASNDGGDYNIYDIYDTCPAPVLPSASRSHPRATNALHSFLEAKGFNKPQTPDTCYGPDLAEDWLDNADVQKALHVTAANQSDWSTCAGIEYTKTLGSTLPMYANLIKNYKVLVYAGDVDACVPYNGSEDWVRNLGYAVKDAWRPWLVNDQVAGYVTEYTASNQFTFLTVKGAGHMVPQYQPVPALEMVTRWLAGKPF